MVKNSTLADMFARGERKGKANSMFIEGDAIFSYGHHFPIAVRHQSGFMFNEDKYSNTTARHKSAVRRALGGRMIVPSNTSLLSAMLGKKRK